MPRSHSAKAQTARTKKSTPQSDLSYETQLIITILLLLFVYPIGLIFMWWWMRNWPLWLKLLITLPLLLGVVAFLGVIVFAISILHNTRVENRMREKMYQQMQITTSPVPSLPTTVTPTITTSGTY